MCDVWQVVRPKWESHIRTHKGWETDCLCHLCVCVCVRSFGHNIKWYEDTFPDAYGCEKPYPFPVCDKVCSVIVTITHLVARGPGNVATIVRRMNRSDVWTRRFSSSSGVMVYKKKTPYFRSLLFLFKLLAIIITFIIVRCILLQFKCQQYFAHSQVQNILMTI